MFMLWKKYKWRRQAKSKLNDSNRRSTNEYIQALKNQSKGLCISCGIGKIKKYTIDQNVTSIKFSCGHTHKEVNFEESITVRETNRVLVVPEGKGKRNFRFEYIQGWFKSTNPELNKGVFKERLIDKRNNKYKERVVNASDKKHIIKDQEQALSEHRGYGSAK